MTPPKATRPKSTWKFRDLVTDATTGRLRESAIWSNIGKATMTWGFIYALLHDNGTEFLWLCYGGVILGHEGASRLLNQRQQALDKGGHTDPPPSP